MARSKRKDHTGMTQSLRRCLPAALAAAFLLTLAGCAKRHLYPGDRRPDDQVAYIEAERFLLANVDVEIDGKQVGSLAQYYIPPGVAGGWPPGRPRKGVSVLPGNHSLAIRIGRYGWAGPDSVACAALPFTSQAGELYRLVIDQDALRLRNARTGESVARTVFTDCPLHARTGPTKGQRSSTLR